MLQNLNFVYIKGSILVSSGEVYLSLVRTMCARRKSLTPLVLNAFVLWKPPCHSKVKSPKTKIQYSNPGE